MKILKIPTQFQPKYHSTYPKYSFGLNMEEIFYQLILKNLKKFENINRIYIPIYWTSYYVMNNYGRNISKLNDFLDTLDNTKKYWTVLQNASGLYYTNKNNLDIIVFSSGGGGINKSLSSSTKNVILPKYGKREIFIGNTSKYFLPLLAYPLLTSSTNIKKNILCSFMGRKDTHNIRCKIYNELKNQKEFIFKKSSSVNEYKNLIEHSIFTLSPRGYGYTSYRLYEALNLCSIPIYVYKDKKVLAYEDELNYNDFCIVIDAKDIKNISNIIKNISKEKIKKMQNKIIELNKSHFNFNGMLNYIIRKLS